MQTAYVNGHYLPLLEASVHIEDRGFQFSDGIYEYMAFYNRRLLNEPLHLKRLERSLKEMRIEMPSPAALKHIFREIIARNSREHGGLYLQMTRGVARRDHAFPKRPVKPTMVMTICAPKLPKPEELKNGVGVITQPDMRWKRRDIKSVSLLANVLAKQEASRHKAREAWLIEGEKTVTEGAVSNAYIVDKAGALVTHPADWHILGGVTREMVLKLARKAGIAVEERAFTLAEAKKAAEAFLTSTSVGVLPVTAIDGDPVGSGKPGEVTRKLQRAYAEHIFKETGFAWPL